MAPPGVLGPICTILGSTIKSVDAVPIKPVDAGPIKLVAAGPAKTYTRMGRHLCGRLWG